MVAAERDERTFADHGIEIPPGRSGEIDTICNFGVSTRLSWYNAGATGTSRRPLTESTFVGGRSAMPDYSHLSFSGPVEYVESCSPARLAALPALELRLPPPLIAETIERFWRSVDTSGGPEACWPWLGALDRRGYGTFSFGGRSTKASRFAELVANGAIPAGMCVCHRCDNPTCCNPAHLFRATDDENQADKIRKGRQFRPFGDRNGMRTRPDRRATGDRAPIRLYPERYAAWHERMKRLSDAQVSEVRSRYADGGVSMRRLASEYGVSPSLVCMIVNGKRR